MKRIHSLSDLLMEELAELLNGEDQLVGELPKMVAASQSSALKFTLENYLEASKNHVHCLQDIFSQTVQNLEVEICQDMKGFIKVSENELGHMEKGPGRDAFIISMAQREGHYKITKYKIAREHSADLGHTKIVELLSDILNEERTMNFNLNELAQDMINVQAIDPKGTAQKEIS